MEYSKGIMYEVFVRVRQPKARKREEIKKKKKKKRILIIKRLYILRKRQNQILGFSPNSTCNKDAKLTCIYLH